MQIFGCSRVVVSLALSLAACSAENGGSCFDVPAPPACEVDGDCPAYRCRCADSEGASRYNVFATCEDGTCADSGEAACEAACTDRGGVAEVASEPNPATVGTPECTAFCDLLIAMSAELGCGDVERCAPYSACEISEGMCAESARAHLSCQTNTAIFECSDDVLILSSDCPESACPEGACVREDG